MSNQAGMKTGRATTSTDQAFTNSQIGPSHMVDQTVSIEGCAQAPTKEIVSLIMCDR
jgi:hypothetical protein